MLTLSLTPHREQGGFHLDRFDAYLDGEFIVTSRQPLLDGARELLARAGTPAGRLTTRSSG